MWLLFGHCCFCSLTIPELGLFIQNNYIKCNSQVPSFVSVVPLLLSLIFPSAVRDHSCQHTNSLRIEFTLRITNKHSLQNNNLNSEIWLRNKLTIFCDAAHNFFSVLRTLTLTNEQGQNFLLCFVLFFNFD